MFTPRSFSRGNVRIRVDKYFMYLERRSKRNNKKWIRLNSWGLNK